MANERFSEKNIDPKTIRLRDMLITNRMTNNGLCKILNISTHAISKLMTGSYAIVNTDLLVKIANYFNVGINDIYQTGCIVDEHNRTKLMILNTVLKDYKVMAKLKRLFTDNEKMFLTEMFKNDVLNNPGLPKKFLINTILEADYYTDLQMKHKIKAENLTDKIEDLNELECFTLLNSLLDYINAEESNIDKLFYIEKRDEKLAKRKKSNHL